MTILKFEGAVDTYDHRSDSENRYSIGGIDFIRAIEETAWNGSVTVALADETFTGDLYADEGSRGYSEYTPGDPAKLKVGPHNILRILERYDGQTITLWVADEPVNTLV